MVEIRDTGHSPSQREPAFLLPLTRELPVSQGLRVRLLKHFFNEVSDTWMSFLLLLPPFTLFLFLFSSSSPSLFSLFSYSISHSLLLPFLLLLPSPYLLPLPLFLNKFWMLSPYRKNDLKSLFFHFLGCLQFFLNQFAYCPSPLPMSTSGESTPDDFSMDCLITLFRHTHTLPGKTVIRTYPPYLL